MKSARSPAGALPPRWRPPRPEPRHTNQKVPRIGRSSVGSNDRGSDSLRPVHFFKESQIPLGHGVLSAWAITLGHPLAAPLVSSCSRRNRESGALTSQSFL